MARRAQHIRLYDLLGVLRRPFAFYEYPGSTWLNQANGKAGWHCSGSARIPAGKIRSLRFAQDSAGILEQNLAQGKPEIAQLFAGRRLWEGPHRFAAHALSGSMKGT